FPAEDSKVRARAVERRRGGNGANALSVLSQFTHHPRPRCELVCALAGSAQVPRHSVILRDLAARPAISTAHCVFRGPEYDDPTAWIVAVAPRTDLPDVGTTLGQSPNGSRTVINHSALPELTAAEFEAKVHPTLERIRAAAAATAAAGADEKQQLTPESVWVHFEGRNVPEMHAMVDSLIGLRAAWQQRERATINSHGAADETSTLGWWLPASTLEDQPGRPGVLSQAVVESPFPRLPSPRFLPAASAPTFTISVEFEKNNRPGLDALLPKADVLFFSRVYAEAKGFPGRPADFLATIRRDCKPGAVLFLTWGEGGAYTLVNSHLDSLAGVVHSPARRITPVDTVGAGDSFAAGVMYAMGTRRVAAAEAAAWACGLASEKCARVGFDGLAPPGL
ncbi:hypothetical protein HK405_009358, partial [Cladochytrium tenue]